MALTSEDEHKLGEIAFDQLIDTHEADFIPDKHRVFCPFLLCLLLFFSISLLFFFSYTLLQFVSHVMEVADRIIAASNRPDITWEVRLIDSPVHNAFAIPGKFTLYSPSIPISSSFSPSFRIVDWIFG